ncbi:hypothetical protein KKF45_05685 [Patescibacteria group bacterium]|nr:hypothetical protein [Patescibacteria group bacterium]
MGKENKDIYLFVRKNRRRGELREEKMKVVKREKKDAISVQHRLYLAQVGRAFKIPVKVLQTISDNDLRAWIIDRLLSFKLDEELPDNACFGLFLAFDLKAKACKECVANRLCQQEILCRQQVYPEAMRQLK